MKNTLPRIRQEGESFDIGSDMPVGVNDEDYKPPFPLTAKLERLTLLVECPQMSEADIEPLKTAERNNESGE